MTAATAACEGLGDPAAQAPPSVSPSSAVPSPQGIPDERYGVDLPPQGVDPRPSHDPSTPAASATAPSAPATATPAAAVYVVDYCVPRDWLTPYHDVADYARTVVDPTYMVPPEYAPPDLVPVAQAGFSGARSDELVRAVLLGDLAALRDASLAAGVHDLEVYSAYRSYAEQADTFNYWVGVLGYDAAAQRAARPGHSEHQLGTGIDFTSPGWEGRFGDWAVETPAGAWMAQHGPSYGFVMSYPAGADAATCYGYEPWHYRWIGREAAAAWAASGVTLHEFLVAAGSAVE